MLLCPIATWAQTLDIKPGLWDLTTTVQMSGAPTGMPAMPNLDKLPPEQRARIEAAMKGMSGTPQKTQSCVTKEGIDKAIADANSRKNNVCTSKVVSASSSKVEIHMECTPEKSDAKTTGDFTVERVDSDHFKGTGAMKSAGANGRPMDMRWSMTGAFVSADCGNVKPAGAK
jgi:hypothetical protein